MLLRASSEARDASVDLRVITDAAAAGSSGVPAAAELVAFAQAVVRGDEAEVARARQELLDEMGPAATVDAAGVVANFQRMVRIADATGIPLDAPVNLMSADLREQLGLDAFQSAANTRAPGVLGRWLGRFLTPLFLPLMKRIRRTNRS